MTRASKIKRWPGWLLLAVVAATLFATGIGRGNGVSDPKRITQMVEQTRQVNGYRPMPILFNEDDHFDFDKPENSFAAAIAAGASWGYFDPGASDYADGYQCPPVNWGINTDRKKAFFRLVAEMSGARV